MNQTLSVVNDSADFSPQLLTLARESRGFTQKELADSISVTQGKISKIEDGLLQVTEDDLVKICSVLRYSRNFFFSNNSRRLSYVSFYRRRKRITARIASECEARMDIIAMQVEQLLKVTEVGNKIIPEYDPDEVGGDIGKIAMLVRKALGLPRGPVKNLVKHLEDAGIVVVHFDFGSQKIDGCSARLRNGTPIIFLNPNLPPDRMFRTLAHELGHLVMHRFPQDDSLEESQAESFASEFLMPESDIVSQFYPVTVDRLARLKLQWGVSMSSLLMRAFELGVIDDKRKTGLLIHMSKCGYRTNEPHSDKLKREYPTLLRELLGYYMEHLSYSKEDMMKMLWFLDPADYELEFEHPTTGLRIIR